MKAIIIARMQTTNGNRGKPDAGTAGAAVNFVHCGVDLPGNYQAYIVTGTGAQLLAISQHANFLVGQQILKQEDDSYDWENAKTAMAPGAITRINGWLTNNGMTPLVEGDSILTLIHKFAPDYVVSSDDVFDAT